MPKTLQIKLWKWNSSLLLRLPLFVTVIKRAVSFMVFNPIRDAMIVENMFALSKLCNALSGLVCWPTLDALIHDVVLADCTSFNFGVVFPRGYGEYFFHFKKLFRLVLRSCLSIFVCSRVAHFNNFPVWNILSI